MSLSLILLIVLGLLVVWLIATYNGLITLRNRVKEAWSDIDVQLKRRHDLIPNLVESVKGYLKHEQGVLENVAKYRSAAMEAQKGGNTAGLAQAEGMLGTALNGLRVAVEAYPDLKANTNVMQLMDELSDTENKIMASRRFYNGQVRDFNTKLEVFPTNMIGSQLKFTAFTFFEIEDPAERQNVKVQL